MGMILRIASSRIVGQGDIVGRSGYFSLNLSANSVMRGRLDARRTLKSLVADLRKTKIYQNTRVQVNPIPTSIRTDVRRHQHSSGSKRCWEEQYHQLFQNARLHDDRKPSEIHS